MSSPRLFSKESQQVSRRIFMDGLIDSINSHIMGTHILSREEISSINSHFNDFDDTQKAYIRNQITPLLPDWKAATDLDASFIFSCLRILGGVVAGSVEASFITAFTDSLGAGLFAGMLTSLAVLHNEMKNWQKELDKNSRMYHFIDSLESCGLQLPVIPNLFEVLRVMSKSRTQENALTQTPASQMTPKPA